MNMYAVRIYKNYDTNKTEVIRVVNSETLLFKDYNVKDIKKLLEAQPDSIKNLEIDKTGYVRLKRLGRRKMTHYKEVYVGKYKIRLYCIVTGYSGSTLSFVADRYDEGPIKGDNATLGEIATVLRLTLNELKLYNAIIDINNNGSYTVVVEKGNGQIYKLPNIQADSVNDIFGKDWTVSVCGVTQAGLELSFIEPYKPMGLAIVPEGVSHIQQFGEKANHIRFPDSLVSLGNNCFEDNEDIMSIRLGKGLRTIPFCCFYNSLIESVSFSGFEKVIEESAFDECYKLKGVIITNAEIIGKRAFCSTSISKVRLLKVKKIGIEAFAFNDKLVSIELGDSLETIMGGAFRCCSKLTEVVIPPGVKSVGSKAFIDCNKLRTVKLSANTIIKEDSFPKRTKIIYY